MTPAERAAKLLTWISTQINGNPELSAECYRTAHELEQFEKLRAALHAPGSCRRCGRPIVNARRGRRRTYCRECRQPSATVTAREMREKFDDE